MKRLRVVSFVLTLLLIIVLSYFQLKPSVKLREIPWYGWDKPLATLGHLFGYFLLAGLYSLCFQRRKLEFFRFLIFASPVMAMGLILETVQIWLPTRNFNIFDISANAIGVALAYFPAKILKDKLGDEF